ncbi:MAG: sensor histidine kinase, partial [Propionicimonas sp.]|nr:sensor histidine kinase [Propionicimonas sp.]
LDGLDPLPATPVVDIPATLPEVLADAALLERILANLLANAARFNPADRPLLVSASWLGDRVELRVSDHGPGIAAADRDRVVRPFQRLGDRDNTTGVGLGLALAQGLAESIGGSLVLDDTPGGGLTAVVSLPAATASAAVAEPSR